MHIIYDHDELRDLEDHELDRALMALRKYFGESAAKEEVTFDVSRTEKGRALTMTDRANILRDAAGERSTARSVVRSVLRNL